MKKYRNAIAVGLLLAICFLGVKNFIAYKFPNSSSGMQAAISQGNIEHLFLGSSLFRQGIDIYTAEEMLEGNSFVLSYNGNQPVQMLEELKMLLRSGVEIDNLYVDLYVYSSALRPAISDTKLIWDLDFQGKCKVYGDMATYSEAGLSDFVDFFIASNNQYMIMYPVFNAVMKNEFYKGGNIRETSGSTREVLDNLITPGPREGINETQAAALLEMIEICREENIQIYFAEVPKYCTLDEADYYIRLRSELENIVAAETIIKASALSFDNSNPAYYQDLFHLSGEGRRTYTKLLLEAVAEAKEENGE